MNLSFKDTKFIIEALAHLLTAHNKRLSEIEDSEEYEDEASFLENDIRFLESLRQELDKTLNENKCAVSQACDRRFSEVILKIYQ